MSNLDEFGKGALEKKANTVHSSPLHTLTLLFIGKQGVATWPQLESSLAMIGCDDAVAATLVGQLEKLGLLIDHSSSAVSHLSILKLTDEGREVVNLIGPLERTQGYPVTHLFVTLAVGRRIVARNPKYVNSNLLPAVSSLVDDLMDKVVAPQA